jgi:hypothetical protein
LVGLLQIFDTTTNNNFIMSAEQIAFFRSRYSEKETSPLAPENQPKSDFLITVLRWWARIKCCYRCFCGSRFRMALSILAMVIVVTLLRDASLLTKWMFSYKDTAQSAWQSYGLLHEPLWKWQSRKEYYASLHSIDHRLDDATIISLMDASQWFDTYGQVDFVCPTEQALSSSSSSSLLSTSSSSLSSPVKFYLCNPKSMAQHHRGCLIYTTGKPDHPHHRLEHALLQALSKPCEIHVFDPFFAIKEDVVIQVPHHRHQRRGIHKEEGEGEENGEYDQEVFMGNETGSSMTATTTSGKNMRGSRSTSSITIHPWGLTGSASSNHHKNNNNMTDVISSPPTSSQTPSLELKSLAETWQLLNHGQRTLDLLVLDCAGCEWDVYTELIEPSSSAAAIAAVSTTTTTSTTASSATTKATMTNQNQQQPSQPTHQQPGLPLQVLMQVHAVSPQGSGGISGNDYHSLLMHHMRQQHYVRFHRVPQVWNGQSGHAQAYSFLKLRPGFFT